MKKNGYTLQDFKRSRILTGILTVVYCIPFLVGFNDFIGLPDEFMIPATMFWVLWPIVLIFSWYMCIERYLYLEFQIPEKRDNKVMRGRIYLSIISMVVVGYRLMIRIGGMVTICVKYIEDIDKIYKCYVIKVILVIYWLCAWLWVIRERKILTACVKLKRERVAFALLAILFIIVLTCVGDKYTGRCLTDLHFQKLDEQYAERYPGGDN